MKKLLILILCCLCLNVKAQVDTINAQNGKLQLQNLKEGLRTYLVYTTDTLLQQRTVGDIWKRGTKLTSYQGKPAVEFSWKWIMKDSVFATVSNICDGKTLAPIYHHATYKKMGKMATEYKDGFSVPIDSIKDNIGFKIGKIELGLPVLSWELDLETYPLLPIKKVGQKFDIAWFDPNQRKPGAYHRYEVIGKDELSLNTDAKVKCWLLKTVHSKDNYAIFWLAEKSREVIKMEQHFKDSYRFKILQY